MVADKNLGGKPPLFKSRKELQDKIDAWLKDRVDNGKPLTITSLAIHLGTSRETLLNYQNKYGYFDTIRRAKELCHNYAEDYLYTGRNTHGAIFNLKNNWGWKDKTEQELTGKDGEPVGITVSFVRPKPTPSE